MLLVKVGNPLWASLLQQFNLQHQTFICEPIHKSWDSKSAGERAESKGMSTVRDRFQLQIFQEVTLRSGKKPVSHVQSEKWEAGASHTMDASLCSCVMKRQRSQSSRLIQSIQSPRRARTQPWGQPPPRSFLQCTGSSPRRREVCLLWAKHRGEC